MIRLRNEVDALKKERDDALALAAARQAETNTWKIRYEQLKPQLAESAATNLQILGSIRQDFIQFIAQQPASQDAHVGSAGKDAAVSDECLL